MLCEKAEKHKLLMLFLDRMHFIHEDKDKKYGMKRKSWVYDLIFQTPPIVASSRTILKPTGDPEEEGAL